MRSQYSEYLWNENKVFLQQQMSVRALAKR
jgi:hypothetical protein